MAHFQTGNGTVGPIGIDHLIALNDEIAALVRAGFPLERGLMDAGGDLPGRLGRIAGVLGGRMARGESLVQALESEGKAIPTLYRAVVEAGARAGRLPAALEGIAGYVRGYAEARRTIGLALVYPLMVAALAYSLFIFFVSFILPKFEATLADLGLKTAAPLYWLEVVGGLVPYWWPVGPIALFLLAIAWIRSGRASGFGAGGWGLVRLLPWSRSMLCDFEAANFTGLLALLIDQRIPLPEALQLAGEASGDSRMIRDTSDLATALKRGDSMASALARPGRSITPLVRWVLLAGQQQGSLVHSLRNLSSTYRKRGALRAEKLRIFLPVVLLFGLGISTTLLYGLALFVPLVNLLEGLSLN